MIRILIKRLWKISNKNEITILINTGIINRATNQIEIIRVENDIIEIDNMIAILMDKEEIMIIGIVVKAESYIEEAINNL